MDSSSQEYANFQYRSLVPERYRKLSGVHLHDFLVRQPWHRPYRFGQLPNGEVRQFERCALCTISHDTKLIPMLVSQSETPIEYEAVLLMGKLLFESSRVQKYITLHKAYECLQTARDITMSALRHALAHPELSLNRSKTRNALIAVFGSTTIDFDNYRHVRLFYEQFGKLLIETDKLLFDRLTRIVDKSYAVPTNIKLLQDFQVRMVPPGEQTV